MPWKMSDATAHTKKANTPGKKQQFATVANKVLKDTGDEGKAIRIANAAVAKNKSGGGRKGKGKGTMMAKASMPGDKKK